MSKKETEGSGRKPLIVNLVLTNRQPDEPTPDVAVYRITPGGDIDRKLGQAEKDKIQIRREWLKLGGFIALGPDIEDPQDLKTDSLQQFRLAQVWDEWAERNAILIPRPLWEGWLSRRICISGSARWCRRWQLDANDQLRLTGSAVTPTLDLTRAVPEPGRPRLEESRTDVPLRRLSVASSRAGQPTSARIDELAARDICRPLCHGVVEIYERVCCCRPWVVLDPRLDELLERLRKDIYERIPWPPEPWPPELRSPDPEPGPFPPEPDPGPFAAGPWPPEPDIGLGNRISRRRVKRMAATFDPAAAPLPPLRLLQDYQTISAYAASDRASADSYIMARSYLLHCFCNCNTRKVGEAIINPDGSFTMCYRRPLIIHRLGTRCTTTYGFNIKQWQGNQWIYIYCGVGQNEFFDEEDTIVLRSYDPRARTCETNPPPVPGEGRPFVLLEDIGSTRSHNLVSPIQTAADGLNSVLPANGGLVYPPGPGETAEQRLRNRPWSMTLPLRLYVHPAMQDLGAEYYRFSVVEADGMGNPVGGAVPQPLNGGVTWSKYVYVGDQVQVHGEGLGPDSHVDSDGEVQSGLYRIPYWDSGHQWQYGQFHHRWNTLTEANGRYLLSVEIFDAAGNRLRPIGASGAGVDTDFHFLHWIDPVNTVQTPFATLQHVFWVDKQACYADIEDLRMNGLASTEECQFMMGTAGSNFSAGYRAFHVNGPPGETFMWYRQLWYHRGLNGPNRTIEMAGNNVPATLAAGSPALSTPQTFASMLNAHTKCTFALNLRTRAKHTNGSRRIHEYDRYDQAAFALEIGS
ncbi:MAG: hypothetical protein GY835_08665 [bacterium]|nr:hypothetical protein [bacterium]